MFLFPIPKPKTLLLPSLTQTLLLTHTLQAKHRMNEVHVFVLLSNIKKIAAYTVALCYAQIVQRSSPSFARQ
jgi:hypothetical protein